MAVFKRRLLALSVVIILGVSILNLTVGCSSAGSEAEVSIDFESGWDSSWYAHDYTSASGLDYWGISTYRSHSETHSAYCAEAGINSVNSIANNINHYYDQDMHSWLIVPIGDISAWDSATFSCYAWYATGSLSLEDYLVIANSTGGMYYWSQWTQTELSSNGWQLISFNLATSTTRVAFFFASDSTVGLGPYEGVYIDDIVVTVTDSHTPESSVGSTTSYETTHSFLVSYTASDIGGSGLAYAELYYKHGTSGAFTLYATAANPSGRWTSSPIEFDSSVVGGDGTYQFYTIAVDASGNREAVPSIPDATTIIDTFLPSTSINILGTAGLNGWYTSSVTIALEASDATSGVASTVYLIDSGDWQTYSNNFLISTEGVHTVCFCSMDCAGNSEPPESAYIKIDRKAPTTTAGLIGDSGENGWYVGDHISVQFFSTDYASHVASTKYRIDNGSWQTYSFGELLPIYKVGSTVIDYYSVDIAGNVESTKSVSFKFDSSGPTVAITYPLADSKVRRDSVTIEWNGADNVSDIDYYEVQVDGGDWIRVGTSTSYELDGLHDGRHSVTVKAADKSGNNATTTIEFGIYTSIWSENGPYHGIPLYLVIALVVLAAILSVLMFWRKRRGSPVAVSVPKEEPAIPAP